jgi:hypothetical protein
MQIDHARLFTGEQSLDIQMDALRQADCMRIGTGSIGA